MGEEGRRTYVSHAVVTRVIDRCVLEKTELRSCPSDLQWPIALPFVAKHGSERFKVSPIPTTSELALSDRLFSPITMLYHGLISQSQYFEAFRSHPSIFFKSLIYMCLLLSPRGGFLPSRKIRLHAHCRKQTWILLARAGGQEHRLCGPQHLTRTV